MDTTAITSADFKSILTAATSQISVGTVVEVLAVGVGASIGLVFMWWGAKKLIAILMKAFRKGKAGV